MDKKAQIWVETAIYTLIGLVIIGIVLAVANPSISKYKDEILIEQTISALNELNNKILETRETVGNKRIVEFRIKKGRFIIGGEKEKINYILEDSRLEYSEAGALVEHGEIKILTEKKAKEYDVSLILDYSEKNINLTYDSKDESKIFSQSSVPYKLSIENLGASGDKTQINIKEIS